jgi:hypothetical protein
VATADRTLRLFENYCCVDSEGEIVDILTMFEDWSQVPYVKQKQKNLDLGEFLLHARRGSLRRQDEDILEVAIRGFLRFLKQRRESIPEGLERIFEGKRE